MPFVKMNIQQYVEEQKAQDPGFKEAWEESREEYRLIGEMTAIRKQQGISQKQLADLSQKKQQSISRIENHETKPSLRSFCNILDKLGYQLKIEKKPTL